MDDQNFYRTICLSKFNGVRKQIPNHLLQAIGVDALTDYFEFLDGLRESGRCNMYGASLMLRYEHEGMSKLESQVIGQVWRDTFTKTLPVEDRVAKALDT